MVKIKQSMKDYCDQMAANGRLSFVWDGGNDSGNWHLEFNGEKIKQNWKNPTISDELADYVGESLDYGSFAGDFDTSGTLVYNAEESAFIGTDYYSYTETESKKDWDIEIKVPENIWFDRLNLILEGNEITATVSLVVLNGPVTDLHTEVEKDLATSIEAQVDEVCDDIEDFNSLYEELQFNHNEFIQKDGFFCLTIKEMDYSMTVTQPSEKHITI